MQELVDVVDENDKIIGQEYKQTCHEKRLWHRGAATLIFKDSDCKELLLQKRSKTKQVKPGIWCVPGGHLSSGESYIEGARREAFEELGKFDSPFTFLFKLKKTADEDHEFVSVFKAISLGPFNIDKKEVEETKFVSLKQVLKDIDSNPEKYTETTIVILKEYNRLLTGQTSTQRM